MTGQVTKAYRLLKKKLPFEFDGFSVIMIFGFIPCPAPHFKRTQLNRHPTKKRALKPPTVKVDTDPVTDTLEEFRQDAIDQGDYFSAFGAAIFKNAYEKNKKQNPQPT